MRASSFVRGLVPILVSVSMALPIAAHAGGDPAAGKANSLACATCHTSSNPAADTPRLVGQREAYIAKQLKAFKAGGRSNPLMAAIAKQLSDADIDNLAAFWASQPAGSDSTMSEAAAAITKTHMAFPKDFPKGYTVYLTANNTEKKLVSLTYVNAIGLAAAKAGKPLPDGSVIFVANHVPKLDGDKPLTGKDGVWEPSDKIAYYAGMEAKAGWGKDVPELLRNANWNYGVFLGDKSPKADVNQAQCFACHKPKDKESYLFSWKELGDKAKAK